MPCSTLIGFYERKRTAQAAADDLREHSFEAAPIRVIGPARVRRQGERPSTAQERRLARLSRTLLDRGVPTELVQLLARGLDQGLSAVTIRIPDPQISQAADILNRHGPVNLETWQRR